jgi:hypothetical protein
VEEPSLADIHPTEELPIAFQVWMHDAIGRAGRKAFELFVQLARAEQRQNHELVEIRAAALDPDLPAHGRVATIATNRIVSLDDFLTDAAFLDDADAHAARILFDRFRRPTEPACHRLEFGHPRPQDVLHLVLRQSFVVLEIVRVDELAQRRRVPVRTGQAAIGNDPAHGIFGRQDSRGAQLIGDTPDIEMLDRALGEILALGNALRLGSALHEGARYSAQPELDRKRHADRSATHDDDLVTFVHAPLSVICRERSRGGLGVDDGTAFFPRDTPCSLQLDAGRLDDRPPFLDL